MEDMDMGRDIEVGSIGILSAVTGGTFASGNNSENQSQGTASQYDLELNILTSLMVQYGVTAKEDVLKLKKDYEHHLQSNQIPQETKDLPMQQQLYLFMTKQDEERAMRRREAQQNYQQQQQQQNQQGNQNQGTQGSQQHTHQNTQEPNLQNNQQHNHPNNQPESQQNAQQSNPNNEHNQQQNN